MTTELTKAAQQALHAFDADDDFAVSVAMDAIRAALTQQATPEPLTGCNCRWQGETQVEWCELHLAHKEAIHEWAERAKAAEAKLKATPEPVKFSHAGHFYNLVGHALMEVKRPDACGHRLRLILDELAALMEQAATPEPVGEPFGWLFQHEETGLVQVVDSQQVEWGFEANNPRWQKIRPVYTRTAPVETEPVGEPALWVLTKQLDQRETTTRGYLWFSNPQNDSWTPLFTRPAPGVPEGFTIDQIADACVQAEISDSKFESLGIALAAAQAKGAGHE